MSRHPPSRRSPRCIVRTSHFSRSEQQALVRAYELALPILREPLSFEYVVKERGPVPQRRCDSRVLLGG
jgi:hypothetical protein